MPPGSTIPVLDSVTHTSLEGMSWRRSLAGAIRSTSELLQRLELSHDTSPLQAERDFPVLVPQSYLARMRPRDPQDPLLLQVLPRPEEGVAVPGFQHDPVGDLTARQVPGLLQKYQGRTLLITTGACAIHCRYCFRRHYPYSDDPHGLAQWEPALQAIRSDASIREVLLSGGDPLVLPDEQLSRLIDEIEGIPHVERLRIHSRLPIVLPDRINAELICRLTQSPLTVVVVVHANHARELVGDCADALDRLRQAGLTVLNQTVLLKGVNDSVEALAELSERCIELGVVPYYLHQLDRVSGAAHFEVPVEQGQQLIQSLRERLPGYLVPRYVTEVAGEFSKRPLMPGE